MKSLGRVTTIVALGVGCAWLATQCSDAPRKPNVVIIAIDTLRPDHLGLYGSVRDTSPNLDVWSKNAVVFENAQTAAPWTAPSLISVMTSLYPSVHGVARFPDPGAMNERVTTLAEVLKRHGYLTGAFTDGGYAKSFFGLGQGFDAYPPNHGDTPIEHASNLAEPDRLATNVERTLEWLDRVGDEPYFLFFHTYQVHGPYRPPEECVKRFRPDYDERAEEARLQRVLDEWNDVASIDEGDVRLVLQHVEHCMTVEKSPESARMVLRRNRAGAQRVDYDAQVLGDKMREFGIGSMDPDRTQAWRDRYDGEIRYTDEQLTRLLARFDANTVVVFVSDHGEGFGEHGVLGHGNVLAEEALRVLLMVRAPGVAARRVTDIARTVDVMPTVLELVGVPQADLKLQGRSLVPLLRGAQLEAAPSFSHSLARENAEGLLWSVRDGTWRLVWNDHEQSGKLFDLGTDSGELLDVSAAHPKVAERLLGLLRAQCELDALFRAQASGPIGPYTLNEKELRELQELGYVGSSEPLESSHRVALPPPNLCNH